MVKRRAVKRTSGDGSESDVQVVAHDGGTIGVRSLKQNASAVIDRVASGESITVTVRGKPAALLTPIPRSRLETFIAEGRIRPATVDLASLPAPTAVGDPEERLVSQALSELRDGERF